MSVSAVQMFPVFCISVDGRYRIGLEHDIHTIPIHIIKGLIIRESGIRIEDIDLIEELLCFCKNAVHTFLGADIRIETDDIVSEAHDPGGMAGYCKDTVSLALSQKFQCFQPDTAGSAGQHDCLIVNHLFFLFSLHFLGIEFLRFLT